MKRGRLTENNTSRCKEKAPLIARIEEEIGWRKLWGDLLDYQKITTGGLQSLSRIMSHHGKGGNPCPCCDKIPDQRTSLFKHFVAVHCRDLSEVRIFRDLKELNFLVRFAWTFK